MGRLKKEHAEITKWKLVIQYTCPITKKKVQKKLDQWDIQCSIQACDLCGEHGDMSISIGKCSSCGKNHYDIEFRSW